MDEVTGSPEVVKSREELIAERLSLYPFEDNIEWYRVNLPDVYVGYMSAKLKYFKPVAPVSVKKQAVSGLKLFLIILFILAVFGVVVYFVFINFINEGLSNILG